MGLSNGLHISAIIATLMLGIVIPKATGWLSFMTKKKHSNQQIQLLFREANYWKKKKKKKSSAHL